MWPTPVIFLYANGVQEPTAKVSPALKTLKPRQPFASKKPVLTITFSSAKILRAKRGIDLNPNAPNTNQAIQFSSHVSLRLSFCSEFRN